MPNSMDMKLLYSISLIVFWKKSNTGQIWITLLEYCVIIIFRESVFLVFHLQMGFEENKVYYIKCELITRNFRCLANMYI